MLELQIRLLNAWGAAGARLRSKIAEGTDERGEVTAQTALIVLLVIAAIAAGGVIAAKINSNANNVPSP